ncbi:hypothetical protein ABVK25_001914 [Lepraria finkii]|uniref:Ribosome assembly protein 3 n=1 Tax=Lepraria finkii TaxID=1340010 RepID=A0ABR4BI80_9LECA
MAKPKKPKPSSPPPKSPSPNESESPSEEASQPEAQSAEDSPETKSAPNPKESFESYYLRRVTTAFADDIDKIRNAPDFTSKSIPVLIQALKQGAHSYTPEEQTRIMSVESGQKKL